MEGIYIEHGLYQKHQLEIPYPSESKQELLMQRKSKYYF